MRVPLHLETPAEAQARGCLKEWRESLFQSIRCKERIDQLISESFDGMYLRDDIPEIVSSEFGRARVRLILANTVRLREGDGRFRSYNREWADKVMLPGGTPDGRIALSSHSEIVNGLISDFREYTEQNKGYTLVNIYQLDPDQPIGENLFRGYSEVDPKSITPDRYRCVFRGYVWAEYLEDVFFHFNEGFEGTYQGHSLSVGDIVELAEGTGSEDKGVYYCDTFGFVRLPDFDAAKCHEMKGIRTLMIQPNCPPVETRVENELTSLQRAVSGQGEDALIEITYPFEDDTVVLGNEESKLHHMAGNRRMENGIYAGPIFLFRDDGMGELTDLTEEQIKTYTERFSEPEDIPDEEVQADCGYEIICW